MRRSENPDPDDVTLGRLHGDYVAGNKIVITTSTPHERRTYTDPRIIIPTREELIAKVQKTLTLRHLHAVEERVVDLAFRFEHRADLVTAPQHRLYRRIAGAEQRLDQPLFDYFLMVEQLLIVGDPGTGKSSLLLEFSQRLLSHARATSTFPIPVIVNLAAYGRTTQSLWGWLPDGLATEHAIPRAIGRVLLDEGMLLLLLDGLDEMDPARRDGCITEINALLAQPQTLTTYLVVCSRTTVYEQGQARINVPAAIELQPLSPAEVEAALAQAGPQTAGLRAAMLHDGSLAELLQTPLMLNTAAHAFAGIATVALAGGTPPAMRTALYDRYLIHCLSDQVRRGRYQPAWILRWLRFLAITLRQDSLSLFLIERMQPAMLRWRRSFRAFVGLAYAVGMIVGWSILGWLSGELITGLEIGLIVGLLLGLGAALVSRPDITPAEQLIWSWRHATSGWKKLLIAGLGLELLLGICGGNLGVGLSMIVMIGLLALLYRGSTTSLRATSAMPNAGIHASIKNGLMRGLSPGMAIGILGGLSLLERGTSLAAVLAISAGGGLFYGVLFGLPAGLHAVVKHYLLRLLLVLQAALPLRLVAFLEMCCHLLLLRRQGGAYTFLHLTLRDYLADLSDDEITRIAAAVEM